MNKIKIKELSSLFLNKIFKENLRLSVSVPPHYVKEVKEKVNDQKQVIHKKMIDLNSWYTKVIGLDEVKRYQDRVVTLQSKLLSVQEERREVGRQLTEIRSRSNELQDQLHKIKRQDNLQRFLDLMKEETEVIKQELEIGTKFNNLDREEREIFTAFTNAIRDSHEKQRAQLEYTKYFGLILSLVGSFLTFCYSTIRKQDLKRFIEEHLLFINDNSQPILIQLQETRNELNKIMTYIDMEGKNHDKTMKTLRDSAFLNTVRNTVENNVNNLREEVTSLIRVKNNENGAYISQPMDKIVLYGCTALFAFVILRLFSG